ncbi:MAG TPA: hypothetical protein VKU41_01935 [Polyangiaceae bacterium]|nr:hypothetical protein [Polyangiaceae bacterium]
MSEGSRVRTKKMLLVAAVGVGTVNYLACGSDAPLGNPGATVPDGSASDAYIASGNLAPPPADGSSPGADVFIGSGNLAAPLPDASSPATDSSIPPKDGSTDAPGAGPDAPSDAAHDATFDRFIGSGNLLAPLPDAGVD